MSLCDVGLPDADGMQALFACVVSSVSQFPNMPSYDTVNCYFSSYPSAVPIARLYVERFGHANAAEEIP